MAPSKKDKKGSDKGNEQKSDDLNGIEEVPDWQPHCEIVAKIKDGEMEGVNCENDKCKSKKIKNNEAVFIHTEKDMNKATKKRWNGVPRHECLTCNMTLVCEKGDITDFPGFGTMPEKAQAATEKLFWKEKSKLSKKNLRARASTSESETKSDPIEGVAAIDIGA